MEYLAPSHAHKSRMGTLLLVASSFRRTENMTFNSRIVSMKQFLVCLTVTSLLGRNWTLSLNRRFCWLPARFQPIGLSENMQDPGIQTHVACVFANMDWCLVCDRSLLNAQEFVAVGRNTDCRELLGLQRFTALLKDFDAEMERSILRGKQQIEIPLDQMRPFAKLLAAQYS